MAKTREEWLQVVTECNSAENIVDEIMKLQNDLETEQIMHRSYQRSTTKMDSAFSAIESIIKAVKV